MWYNVNMENTFISYNINLSREKIKKFDIYYELLVSYNEKFNITAVSEKKDIYLKHFVDSLFGRELLISGKLIDVGSGGGFPAVPLKIFNDGIKVTMVEATGKKCEFLKVLIKELDLKDTVVLNARAEDLAKDNKFREKFDYCTARAVARLNSLCEYCIPLIKVGGYFVAYKGDAEEELLESENAIKVLGGKVEKTLDFSLEGAKRKIISIKKEFSTEKKYPRNNVQIRKKPL